MSKFKQKYAKGTLVFIAKDLGHSMRHFRKGVVAKVIETYGSTFGGDNFDQYGLDIMTDDGTWEYGAWYYEHQLSEINSKLERIIYGVE